MKFSREMGKVIYTNFSPALNNVSETFTYLTAFTALLQCIARRLLHTVTLSDLIRRATSMILNTNMTTGKSSSFYRYML